MSNHRVYRVYDNALYEATVDQKRDFNIDGTTVPFPFPIQFPFPKYDRSFERRTPLPLAKQYYKNPVPAYVTREMQEWSIIKLFPTFYDGVSNEIWIRPSWWTSKLTLQSMIFNYFDNWWTALQDVNVSKVNKKVLGNSHPHVYIKIKRNNSFTMVDPFDGSMLVLVRINYGDPIVPPDEFYK